MKKTLFILCALMLTWIGARAGIVDYTSQMGSWNSSAHPAGIIDAYENYTYAGISEGKVLYQTVTGLPAGTYNVSFYAATNVARDLDTGTYAGEGIAQAYATSGSNTVTKAMTVGTLSGISCWTADDLITLTVEVNSGSLEFGIQNLKTGGQWYCVQNESLILTSSTQAQGDLVHGCEVVRIGLDETRTDRYFPMHWSTQDVVLSNFHVNTWSSEGATDGSGMTTPFIEYWMGSGTNLTDAVISHETLTGLTPGLYEVSVLARAYNEGSTNAVGSGITFNANSAGVDLTTGTTGTSSGSAEVYGTYTLVAEVDASGTLDINFKIQSETSCDWLAWKDLKVVYDGESLPDLEVVTGDMNATVEATMKAAVDAYNSDKTADNYTAALAAIEAAEASVAYYAPIIAAVNALDEDGATVWAASSYATMLTNRTLTNEDVSADLAAAQIAQTTANRDLTYVVLYTGSWSAPYDADGVAGTSANGYPESYASAAYTADEGQILYKTITGLQPGTYAVTFYAAANVAWVGVSSGSGIAQAFANDGTPVSMAVGTETAYTFTESDKYTITCTVGMDGTLTFGIENIGTGGNWYVAEAVSLTLVELADITIVKENIFLKNVYGGDLVSRGKNLGVAADVDCVGTPLTLYSYDGGSTVVIWYADADISNADTEHQSYLGGTNWATANNAFSDAVYFTMTETQYTDEDGNQATSYQFESEYGLLYRYDAASTPETLPSSDNTYRLAVNGTKDTNYSDDNQAIWVIVTTAERDAIKAQWVADQKMALAEAAGITVTSGDDFDKYVASLTEVEVVKNEISSTDAGEWSGGTYTEYGVESYQTYVRLNRSFDDLDPGIYKITLNGFDRNSDPAYSLDMYNDGYTDLSESYIYANGYEINLQPWASEATNATDDAYYYPNWMSEASACFEEGKYLNTLYTYVDEGGDLTIQIALLVTEYFGWAQVKNFSLYRLEQTETTIEWTMTDANWGTLILPFAASVPEGLTAYSTGDVTTSDDEGVDATLSLNDASDAIKANTPYIMAGTEGTYTFTGTPVDATSLTSGKLTGTYETMDYTALAAVETSTSSTVYLLQNHTEEGEGGVAFYPVVENYSQEATLTPYHCYLTLSASDLQAASSVPAKLSFSFGGEATGIVAVESEEAEANGAIYDLSGRKVSKAVKGVYIQNGKKVLVK